MKILLCCLVATLCTFSPTAASDNSFVVSSEEPPQGNGKETSTSTELLHPIIYAMDIKSNISNRFAKTLVVSRVKNADTKAKEATFTVVLPEKAFISEFVMEIGGKSYKAYVKEKTEAKNIYDKAVATGQSAGHVEVSARDSNRFTVSLNIEPESKASFLLTYEELLERRNNQYELILNIHPGQIVKDLNVEVLVNESRPLKFVKTPALRSGNEISKNDDKLEPASEIQVINSTSAVVKFHPDAEAQKQFAKDMGVKENEGLSGQFVVQYDVERDPSGGECNSVLLHDGYFVHFFAPEDLEPLPKHVVFVLDTSSSMSGRKIDQLKDAMKSILKEIRREDVINIVEFNSDVYVWDIATETSRKVGISEPFEDLVKNELPPALPATNNTLNKARNVIDKIQSWGITNIIGGLETALHLVKRNLRENAEKPDQHQPMIIFLTDGQPNVRVSSTTEITKIVTRLNRENNKAPIFSLSFGEGADKSFLRKLSLQNLGFSRHIYEASDASLQLQEFYRLISSPLLSNIEFKYDADVKEVTKTHFPIFFKGSECVVAGRFIGSDLRTKIEARGPIGTIILTPKTETPVTSLERLWAYLTLKQKLDERETAENKTELTKQALDLALKYSFVTEVSSLVVVKPNETSAVDTEDASRPSQPDYYDTRVLSVSGTTYYIAALPAPPMPNFMNKAYIRPSPSFANRAYPRTSGMGAGGFSSGFHHMSSLNRPMLHTYRPVVTTYRTTVTPHISTLEDSLPWLSHVLDANKSLNISGGIYELGEHASVPAGSDCPRTPLNGTASGQCSLLKDCTEVFTYLTDFQVYQQYFCPLQNKYAGVCCPKKPAV